MKNQDLASEDFEAGLRVKTQSHRPTHCTRCGGKFVHDWYQGHLFREIPVYLGRPNDPNREILCYKCAGHAPPRVMLWEPGDREHAKFALLDSLKHPERYLGWHVGLNGGYAVKASQPGDLPPKPTAGDVSVAKHAIEEEREAA